MCIVRYCVSREEKVTVLGGIQCIFVTFGTMGRSIVQECDSCHEEVICCEVL